MIKHVAADGKKSGMVLISSLSTKRPDLSGAKAKVTSHIYKSAATRSRFEAKFMRLTLILLGLGTMLLGQITVSVLLKQNGIISKDLHDIVSERLSPVAERVIPEIQHRLEFLESRMLETIELAKFMAPNINETLYGRGINKRASKTKGMARMATTQENQRPGLQHAKKHGLKSKYPVVMVPGFVTSGLEVWKGKSCMKNVFRERVWGGLASAQYWLRERSCIMENLALDPISGGDPKDIKLRSSQGFAAADYFFGYDWMCK